MREPRPSEVAAVGGTAWTGVAEEQAQPPTLRAQQAIHRAAAVRPFAEGVGIEQIGLQPTQLCVLAVAAPRFADGFMAASASRNQHRPIGLGCPGVMLNKASHSDARGNAKNVQRSSSHTARAPSPTPLKNAAQAYRSFLPQPSAGST
jgi:hypothetical protein